MEEEVPDRIVVDGSVTAVVVMVSMVVRLIRVEVVVIRGKEEVVIRGKEGVVIRGKEEVVIRGKEEEVGEHMGLVVVVPLVVLAVVVAYRFVVMDTSRPTPDGAQLFIPLS